MYNLDSQELYPREQKTYYCRWDQTHADHLAGDRFIHYSMASRAQVPVTLKSKVVNLPGQALKGRMLEDVQINYVLDFLT